MFRYVLSPGLHVRHQTTQFTCLVGNEFGLAPILDGISIGTSSNSTAIPYRWFGRVWNVGVLECVEQVDLEIGSIARSNDRPSSIMAFRQSKDKYVLELGFTSVSSEWDTAQNLRPGCC